MPHYLGIWRHSAINSGRSGRANLKIFVEAFALTRCRVVNGRQQDIGARGSNLPRVLRVTSRVRNTRVSVGVSPLAQRFWQIVWIPEIEQATLRVTFKKTSQSFKCCLRIP